MIGDFLKNHGLLLGLGAVSAVALIGWVAPSLQNPDRVNTTPVERAVFVPAQVQEQVQTPAAEAPAPVRPRKWYQASVQKPSPTVAHRAIPAEAPPVPQESPRLKQRPVEVPAAERSEPQAQVENRPPARRDPVVVERSRDKSIAIMAGGAALGAVMGRLRDTGRVRPLARFPAERLVWCTTA
jgi:hypothetical protein